jgi:hypothetical protein
MISDEIQTLFTNNMEKTANTKFKEKFKEMITNNFFNMSKESGPGLSFPGQNFFITFWTNRRG